MGTSLSDIYRGGLERIRELNWLDPLRVGFPTNLLRDPFARPTAVELARGFRANIGGIRMVNILNPAQTGFGELTMGPYLVKLAESY